jgi:hypothetical protein
MAFFWDTNWFTLEQQVKKKKIFNE